MPLSGDGGLGLGSNETTTWQETITGLGDATLQCQFKDFCP